MTLHWCPVIVLVFQRIEVCAGLLHEEDIVGELAAINR